MYPERYELPALEWSNAASKCPTTAGAWTHLVLATGQSLTYGMLMRAFLGEVSGLLLPKVYSECEMRDVASAVLCANEGFEFKELGLGSALGMHSHWEYRYLKSESEWPEYFEAGAKANATRKKLFAKVGDPVEAMLAMLMRAWPGRVSRLRHPRLGRPMHAGMMRTGAPLMHYDWARHDLNDSDVLAQLGWNLYVFNPGPDGDLVMYRKLGEAPGNTAASGAPLVGNYDLPRSEVRDVERDVLYARTGDMVFVPNRYWHEVTPCAYENERLTVAAHVVLLRDGSLGVFS